MINYSLIIITIIIFIIASFCICFFLKQKDPEGRDCLIKVLIIISVFVSIYSMMLTLYFEYRKDNNNLIVRPC